MTPDLPAPSVPESVLAYIHAYGDSRADEDGLSGLRIAEAILALRRWAAELLGARSTAAQPAGWKLTRSIIHECPALVVPQTWVQELGMTAQLVVLKGADEALAQRILSALNAAHPAASGDSTPPSKPVQGDSIGAPRPEPETADEDRGPAPPRVTGSPNEIWLNYGDIEDDCTHDECYHAGGVTWCQDKVFDSDVRYVLAPPATSQQADREAE